MDFSIRVVAMIALGVMVVALIFLSFDQWFTGLLDGFIDELEFPTP